MGDLRDRLEEHFLEMDELRRDRDLWRDRYLALVDEKDKRRNDIAMRADAVSRLERALKDHRGADVWPTVSPHDLAVVLGVDPETVGQGAARPRESGARS